MKKVLLSVLPDFLAILVFVVLSYAYFSPVIEGKVMSQGDMRQVNGMTHELDVYHEQTGKDALWTNSIFGGMPAYQIRGAETFNIYHKLQPVVRLFLPYFTVGILFMYLLGFYFLLRVLRLKPMIAFLGAVAFSFTSYNLVIILAGHITKAYAISYMGPVIAGMILTYRGNYIAGGLITMFAAGMEIATNHLQITYYLFLIMMIYIVLRLFNAIKIKNYKSFLVASAIMVAAFLFAVLPNATSLWTTYEYTRYSTRGPSELTEEGNDHTTGLDKSYILNDYSYGVEETMTLLIPDFMGGPSAGSLPGNSKVAALLRQSGYPEAQIKSLSNRMPTYHGNQRFTAGPVYIGAITIFLFVFAMFFLEGPVKWWLLSATILSVMLAWGKNFMSLSNIFIDYFPGYNKFRTVSMILVIASFTVPLGALLGLKEVFSKNFSDKKIIRALKYSYLAVGGITLFFALLGYNMINFSSTSDQQLPDQIAKALLEDRATLLRLDAFRSFVFISLAAGILFLCFKKVIKTEILLPGLILLTLVDLWAVDKRYLNNDMFMNKRAKQTEFAPTPADTQILKDTSHYRVLNLTVDPFNDATTSYYHNSIGGYHGAKMKRFQQLIERYIAQQNMDVLDMMNTKYFITASQDKKSRQVVRNPGALGNAWFVDSLRWVATPDDEIRVLGDIDPSTSAVINNSFRNSLGEIQFPAPDSTDRIALTSYAPDELTYSSQTSGQRFAVFSEVYYPKGWKATIDGKDAPIAQVDFVLRGLAIPEGEHTIHFTFHPTSYYTGKSIALASSVLSVLLLFGALGFKWKENRSGKKPEDKV